MVLHPKLGSGCVVEIGGRPSIMKVDFRYLPQRVVYKAVDAFIFIYFKVAQCVILIILAAACLAVNKAERGKPRINNLRKA
jgi:hypothetical protein